MKLRPIGTVFAHLLFTPLRDNLKSSQQLDGLRHSLYSYAHRVSSTIARPHPGSDLSSHRRLPVGYSIRFICSTTSSTEARDTCRVVCRSSEFSTCYIDDDVSLVAAHVAENLEAILFTNGPPPNDTKTANEKPDELEARLNRPCEDVPKLTS